MLGTYEAINKNDENGNPVGGYASGTGIEIKEILKNSQYIDPPLTESELDDLVWQISDLRPQWTSEELEKILPKKKDSSWATGKSEGHPLVDTGYNRAIDDCWKALSAKMGGK